MPPARCARDSRAQRGCGVDQNTRRAEQQMVHDGRPTTGPLSRRSAHPSQSDARRVNVRQIIAAAHPWRRVAATPWRGSNDVGACAWVPLASGNIGEFRCTRRPPSRRRRVAQIAHAISVSDKWDACADSVRVEPGRGTAWTRAKAGVHTSRV
ncbi:hypothetical protein HYPSUDRAFT_829520 [Hypholoma sublateritium FD-334 SS-4]|uniref:Uncharacterized protein n=1 Tax=Hypholoma sublateritium (strain FD-334 SS-4) TaxID=945553 RepID=A0A0D2PJK3_HYPSF|nr:hypothetical protein HYPSUDRAFT_829520 [Hypholoma sublateritium FD-334 SS-4]